MAMHENVKPGIYIDEVTGDIWRKTPRGPWTVNGEDWTPFPKALTTLTTVTSGPVVSISDAVSDESRGDKAWHVIPDFPNYEMNVVREVRHRDSKAPVGLCCSQPHHAYYWLVNVDGKGDWVKKAWI